MKAQCGMTEAETLEARGFDGLYNPTEPCGCMVTDLRPCGHQHTGCRGGLIVETDLVCGVFAPRVAKALRGVRG